MQLETYIADKVKYLQKFNAYTQKIKAHSYEIHPEKLSELSLFGVVLVSDLCSIFINSFKLYIKFLIMFYM